MSDVSSTLPDGGTAGGSRGEEEEEEEEEERVMMKKGHARETLRTGLEVAVVGVIR